MKSRISSILFQIQNAKNKWTVLILNCQSQCNDFLAFYLDIKRTFNKNVILESLPIHIIPYPYGQGYINYQNSLFFSYFLYPIVKAKEAINDY